eukprot:SAG31_NODE_3051_length_4742_cov_35.992031_3_plen_191_part_00
MAGDRIIDRFPCFGHLDFGTHFCPHPVPQGPPTSIQLATGRIIVPTAICYNGGKGRCRSQEPGDWFAVVLYSDDFGVSFSVSNKEEGGNECQAAQLLNGSLVLNQRTRGPLRQLSYSHDGGVHWTQPRSVALAGPAAATCCGSTVSAEGATLIFSGPDSTERRNMSIFSSRDAGRTTAEYRSPPPSPHCF